MISRRNIRIKVMQLLYAIDATNQEKSSPKETEVVTQLKKQIEQTRTLLVFMLSYLIEIAQFAEIHAQQRASKNIVTQEDLNVNIKIAGNEFVWHLLENEAFNTVVNQNKVKLLVEDDLVKKIFLQLIQTPEYAAYIAIDSRDKKSDTEIIHFIFTDLLLANESFIAKVEELFQNWDDDCEVIEQMVMQYLNKPKSINFKESISADKWLYAKELLTTVLEKDEALMDLIKPKLKNWDSERIAVIDMLLLKMGISELLFFETIPTKVTINEYIDIAKDYSTKQSGQFVNGILDSIHKDLISQNKIQKVEFRKN
ncbi:transcription antitermination factor NusB [Arachidicoccus sp.]|uniref:transcription antitermination factor NusB n=1 Tax=Arachidicoccus sp. TaxID=1872624 RepID=UPI003D210A6F